MGARRQRVVLKRKKPVWLGGRPRTGKRRRVPFFTLAPAAGFPYIPANNIS